MDGGAAARRRRRRQVAEPAARRVLSAVLKAVGLGGALAVVPVAFVVVSQMDTQLGQSPSPQERLFLMSLLALIFLFLGVIAAVIFVGGFVVSTLNRLAEERQRDELTRKEIRQSILLGRGPAYLVGFDLADFDLSLARWLRGAVLTNAILTRANLEASDLGGASLERADLQNAILVTTNLRDARLEGANLSNADLSGADLSGADLRKARLVGANLSGAHLEGADLTGANLTGALLTEAFLDGARLEGATLPEAR